MKHSQIKISFERLCDVDTDLLKGLIKLDQDVMKHYWTESSWADASNSGCYLLIMAYLNDDLSGAIVGRWDRLSHIFDLDKIMVGVDYQGKGVGQILLNWLGKSIFTKVENIKNEIEIFLEVDITNLRAKRLYDKNGFTLVREVKKFYSDGSDAVILKKIVRI